MKLIHLRLFKLFVLVIVPVLGLVYYLQFFGKQESKIVPFQSFRAPVVEVSNSGNDSKGDLPLRENVTLVNFWATWCPPCVEEFPAMVELQRRFEGKGLEIVFVSVDEKWEDVEKFLNENVVDIAPSRMYWDPSKSASRAFGSTKFPESYVIRKDGWVVEKIVGLQTWTRPSVIEYFDRLSGKFSKLSGLLMNQIFPAAFANDPISMIHEEDKRTLEKLKKNIETASKNLINAQAVLIEEERAEKELKNSFEKREEDLSEGREEVEKLNEKIADVKNSLRRSEEAFKKEDSEKDRLEKEMKKIREKISDLEDQLEDKRSDLVDHTSRLNTRLQKIESIEEAKRISEEEIRTLNGRKKNAAQIVQERESLLKDNKKAIDKRQKRIAKVKDKISDFESTLAEQKTKLKKFGEILKK